MVHLKKWYMLSNHRVLRIPNSLTMSTSSIRRSMDLNKLHVRGMRKRVKGELFICQVYVDDIIFGSTKKAFNDEFSKLMTDRFEMSMMGELKFFLGFEIKQLGAGLSSLKLNISKICLRSLI
jgi:hypothetical protein